MVAVAVAVVMVVLRRLKCRPGFRSRRQQSIEQMLERWHQQSPKSLQTSRHGFGQLFALPCRVQGTQLARQATLQMQGSCRTMAKLRRHRWRWRCCHHCHRCRRCHRCCRLHSRCRRWWGCIWRHGCTGLAVHGHRQQHTALHEGTPGRVRLETSSLATA